MGKEKISRRRKISSKNIKTKRRRRMKPIELKSKKGISKMDPFKILKDKKHFLSALLECFEENDHEALIEILDGYIAVYNKTEFAQKANISRSTLYDMLHGKKNPTLRVFTQCVHELVSG